MAGRQRAGCLVRPVALRPTQTAKGWTATPANVATYAYDARWRLSSRIVTQAGVTTTTYYIHDLADRIIAELDGTGQTQREYIWADDMPVAVVDGVASGAPTLYYVHVDHLMRPIRMTVKTRPRLGRRATRRSAPQRPSS